MATVTGLTAERMLEIEAQSIVDGEIIGGNLILTTFGGTPIDAGPLPEGPQGPTGPAGGQIPGEIKMWPGTVLPDPIDYGNWAWADGAIYDTPLYPIAEANIATQWRTFGGASDPGVNKFRVPDLRGLVPAGMDAMPAGVRANRTTRAVAITIAGKTGEETHVVTIPEMPVHDHDVTVTNAGVLLYAGFVRANDEGSGYYLGSPATLTVDVLNKGGGQAHENMQPTVFIPYIVKLDD